MHKGNPCNILMEAARLGKIFSYSEITKGRESDFDDFWWLVECKFIHRASHNILQRGYWGLTEKGKIAVASLNRVTR